MQMWQSTEAKGRPPYKAATPYFQRGFEPSLDSITRELPSLYGHLPMALRHTVAFCRKVLVVLDNPAGYCSFMNKTHTLYQVLGYD